MRFTNEFSVINTDVKKEIFKTLFIKNLVQKKVHIFNKKGLKLIRK